MGESEIVLSAIKKEADRLYEFTPLIQSQFESHVLFISNINLKLFY